MDSNTKAAYDTVMKSVGHICNHLLFWEITIYLNIFKSVYLIASSHLLHSIKIY